VRSLDESLLEAVSLHRVGEVRELLRLGADPNYRASLDEDEPDGLMQPTTPLRMVMFAISDCMLDDDGLRDFLTIAQMLLDHGADPGPAMEIAEDRYGKYSPDLESSPFLDVWHAVAKAHGASLG
jgi:hypothetical protein